MTMNRASRMFLATVLGLAAASNATELSAQQKKDSLPATAPAGEPALATKPITHELAGVTWGQSSAQVIEAVHKILDEDYKPLYAKVSPGVKMKQLDAALAEEKASFAGSRLDYSGLRRAADTDPWRTEYTYNNQESKLQLTRKGTTYHFFFIRDKHWKLIAERPLGANHSAGVSYTAGVAKTSADLGAAGRSLAASAEQGRLYPEADWRDATTHLRVIDRGAAVIGFGYEDRATLAILPSLRTHRPL